MGFSFKKQKFVSPFPTRHFSSRTKKSLEIYSPQDTSQVEQKNH